MTFKNKIMKFSKSKRTNSIYKKIKEKRRMTIITYCFIFKFYQKCLHCFINMYIIFTSCIIILTRLK